MVRHKVVATDLGRQGSTLTHSLLGEEPLSIIKVEEQRDSITKIYSIIGQDST